MGTKSYADLISGACPESISDHPKFGPKLAITICLLFEIPLSNISRKHQPPIMTPEPRPQAKSYFIRFSSYHLSTQKNVSYGVSLRIFRFHCFSRALTSKKLQKPVFFILSLPGFILKRLCSRQVPHVGSHPNSLYPGISDLSI